MGIGIGRPTVGITLTAGPSGSFRRPTNSIRPEVTQAP